MMRKNSTLICVPVTRVSIDETLNDIHRAKASCADLVEIDLGILKNFSPFEDLKSLINASPLPTLFTFRPKCEGGFYDGDERKRFDVLRLAVELGADYVEVELQVAHEFIKSIGENKPDNCKIIVSSHNFNDTPSVEDLGNIVASIQATGADIVKIATTALDIADVARVFQITAHSQVPIIGLVSGEKGLISRILSPKFGGFLTYATLDPEVASAPSQSTTIDDLLELFNFRSITPDTKVFGLIGKPVAQSKSPFLYNAAFKSVGFNGIYVPFLVDDAAKFLQTYSSPDFAAFSCTLPYKSVAVKFCDEVDPVAKSIGAVNLIIKRESDGKLLGFNTDYVGAITAIENGLRGMQNISNSTVSPLEGKLFVVMGAGGAGKALAYGAKEKGARVVIANRTFERAKQLAKSVGGAALPLADLKDFEPEEGTILANATPVGMQPNVNDTPLPKYSFSKQKPAVGICAAVSRVACDSRQDGRRIKIGLLRSCGETQEALRRYTLVFDAVYAPKMTRLLKEAQESGATIVTGLEMFIGQAYGHYEGFTGLPAPKELFRKIMSNY